PTTGLHFSDIELLTRALYDLRDAGNSILLIEHNLDLIACADWVIDMGPGGGERGGRIVASGQPESVSAKPESHTGQHLKLVLAEQAQHGPALSNASSRGPQKAARSAKRPNQTRTSKAEAPRAPSSGPGSSQRKKPAKPRR